MYVDYINNVHHASEFVINKIMLHNRNLHHLLINARKTCKGKCQLYELLYYHLLNLRQVLEQLCSQKWQQNTTFSCFRHQNDFLNNCVWFGVNAKW